MAPVTLRLECGHYIDVPNAPRDWDTEECPECGWQEVTDVYRYRWVSRCGDCGYMRQHGNGRAYAERAKERHIVATGHRTAYIRWEPTRPPGIVLTVATPSKDVTTYSAPPF